MTRVRPGAKARELLGGDEHLHVFARESEAAAYLLAVPGSRVWSPTRPGWGNVLHAAITGGLRVRDLTVRLYHPRGSRAFELALEIAVALYDRGAVAVQDANGGLIRAHQRTWGAQR